MKDFLIATVFLIMIVAPALSALNVVRADKKKF